MCDGVVLYFDTHNYILLKVGFGEGSNNFVELNAIRFLMSKALEWGVQLIQIFGDSKITINWANGVQDVTFYT